jgi:quercetin dioxygenase-like cupin family protein
MTETDLKPKFEPIFSADGLKVVRLTVPAGGAVPEHHANVDVVVSIVRGAGSFVVDQKERRVRQGDVIVLPPRAPHSVTADEELELIVVQARVTSDVVPTPST